jgi:hypothetical protein
VSDPLHAPLRRAVRAVVAADPKLRRAARRPWLARLTSNRVSGWIMRLGPVVVLGLFGRHADESNLAGAAAATLVGAIILSQAGQLRLALAEPAGCLTYLHLPIEDGDAAQRLLRPRWRRFAWHGIDALAWCLTAGAMLGLPWGWSLLWAACQTVVVAACVVWWAALFPAGSGCLGIVLGGLSFAAIQVVAEPHGSLGSRLAPLLTAIGDCLPVGWLALALRRFAAGSEWMLAVPLGLALAAAASLPHGVRRLIAAYIPPTMDFSQSTGAATPGSRIPDATRPGNGDVSVTGTSTAPAEVPELHDSWLRLTQTAPGTRLRACGRLARIGAALLPNRLLPLADALQPHGNWDRQWLRAAAAVAVFAGLQPFAAHLPILVWLAPLLLAAMFALPLAGGGWAVSGIEGQAHPLTLLPLRGRDIARVLLTGNSLRIVAALPLILLAALLVDADAPWTMRLGLGTATWGALLAAHPLWVCFALANLRSQPHGITRFDVLTVGIALGGLLVGGTCGILMFVAPPLFAVLCWLVLYACCAALLAHYLRGWNRCRIDVGIHGATPPVG